MTDPSFSAIRARLRYASINEFIEGYARYISAGGMFIPMTPAKLKPIGTTVRFQFLLGDGGTALLGEGVVRQIRGLEQEDSKSPIGMLVKFTKLSQDSKILVDRIAAQKAISKYTDLGDDLDVDDDDEPELPPKADDAPTYEAPVEATKSDTGVYAADLADQLTSQSSPGAQLSAAAPGAHSGSDVFGFDDDEESIQPARESQSTRENPAAPKATPYAEEPNLFLSPDEDEDEDEADPASLFDDAFAGVDAQHDAGGYEEAAEPAAAAVAAQSPAEATERQALHKTEAGLQVMAFDEGDDDAAAAAEFERFALGGDEGDIDQMFDDIFGGGDDFFGGALDPEPEPEPSFGPPSEPEPVSAPPEPRASIEISESYFNSPDDVVAPPAASAPAAPQAVQHTLVLDDDEPEEELAFGFDKPPEQELSEQGEAAPAFRFEEPEPAPVPQAPVPQAPVPQAAAPSKELLNLLGSIEESDAQDEDFSLNLGPAHLEEPSSEAEDAEPDSFEALLANAQKELQSKQKPEENKPKDILDALLGDDDLPPPPTTDASPFAMPEPAGNKEKKGFMSKLFNKE